jgi:hypothetical protein
MGYGQEGLTPQSPGWDTLEKLLKDRKLSGFSTYERHIIGEEVNVLYWTCPLKLDQNNLN